MADRHDIRILSRPGNAASRVGLFGGTFDPVHLGHVHAAEEVKAAFGLSRVFVIPSSVPPHKPLKVVSDAEDRLQMVRLCFDTRPGFDVSDVELNRRGPSYTIDTLHHFVTKLDARSELLMIIGSDAFFELHTWRDFDRILETVPLIVVERPSSGPERGLSKVKQADAYLADRVTTGYGWNKDLGCFDHSLKKNIYFFQGSPWNISSTEIRHRVKSGLDVTPWLQKEVGDYIKNKGLYA